MICPNCGKSNESNSMFCESCGCRLPEIKEKKRPNKIVILISAIVIVMALTALTIVIIRKVGDSPEKDIIVEENGNHEKKVSSRDDSHLGNELFAAASPAASSAAPPVPACSEIPAEAVSSAPAFTNKKQKVLLDFADKACYDSNYYAGSSVDGMLGYIPNNDIDRTQYYLLNENPHEAMYYNQYVGILTYAAGDYDNDQEDELLIVRIKPAEYGLHTITYEMYEIENGSAVLKSYYNDDSLTLSDTDDSFTAGFFVKKFNDRIVIYYENTAFASITGDGTSWCFNAVSYSGDNFKKVGNGYEAGSDVYYDNGDFDDYIGSLAKAGAVDPAWRPFSDEADGKLYLQGDTDAVCIGSVVKTAVDGLYDITKNFSPEEGDEIRYAVTDFVGNQNDVYISALSPCGDFSSAADNAAVENHNTDYILPNSDSQYLSDYDLVQLTPEELRLARNEIYARHGRIFKDEALQQYFSSKDWYVPQVAADDFTDDMLNDYEKANKDLIAKYEKSY